MRIKKGLIFSVFSLSIFITLFNYYVVEDTLIKSEYSDIIMHFLGIILFIIISVLVYDSLLNKVFYSKRFMKIIKSVLNLYIKNSSIKTTKDYKKIWKRIVLKIESTHHISLLDKIKDLDSYEDVNFPKYQELNKIVNEDKQNTNTYIHKYDFNNIFLNKIREFAIFFEMLYDKYQHKSMYEEYKLDKNSEFEFHKNYIYENMINFYKMKYIFRLLLDLKNFLITLLPLITVLFISNVFFDQSDKYNLFLTAIIYIALIYPLLRLVDSIFQISLLYTIKFHTNKNILVHGFYLVLLAYCFTLLGLHGIDLFYQFELDYKPTAFGEIFAILKDLIFTLNVSEIYISDLFALEGRDEEKFRFIIVIKLIILVILIRFLVDAINYFYEKFDQFYYEQKIKRYLLPPELLRILGLFIVGIIALGYVYLIFSDMNYKSDNKLDNNSSYESKGVSSAQVDSKIAQSLKLKQEQEDTTFEKLIPFSIFIALLGGILAISTRDIMDNYFAGLSLKINPPYEVGNSVRILDYGMLVVKEIGTRSDTFYEIESNSQIHIPHKTLANLEIKNYTQPTLDYRSTIELNIVDKELKNKKSIPREAEKVLLLASFISTGVQIPIFPTLDKTVTNRDLDISKIEKLKDSLNNYKNYIKENKEGKKLDDLNDESFDSVWKIQLDKVWKTLTDLSIKYQQQFFVYEIIKVIKKNSDNEKNIDSIYSIKKTIIGILLVLEKFHKIQEDLKVIYDESAIQRKKGLIGSLLNQKSDVKIDEFAEILVNISFYYYMLANRLWKLKDIQSSDTQKNTIDNAMTELLIVPRVTSEHKYQDGSLYWQVKLLVTLELAEQSDETIHHINMYCNELMNYFIAYKDNKNDERYLE